MRSPPIEEVVGPRQISVRITEAASRFNPTWSAEISEASVEAQAKLAADVELSPDLLGCNNGVAARGHVRPRKVVTLGLIAPLTMVSFGSLKHRVDPAHHSPHRWGNCSAWLQDRQVPNGNARC